MQSSEIYVSITKGLTVFSTGCSTNPAENPADTATPRDCRIQGENQLQEWLIEMLEKVP